MHRTAELKIALVQTDLYWEDALANLSMLEEKLWEIPKGIDLVVLPEMFSTGFSMNADKISEPMNLTTFKWLRQMSAQLKAAVVGSFAVKENGKYYNRAVFIQPDGSYSHYDKRHLFRMSGEDVQYTRGESPCIVTLKGWNICLQICYDLRFPVWSRNVNNAYDCLIYLANWPEARQLTWDTLLCARALENLSYVVGVNRVGTDANGIRYTGHSACYSGKGETLLHAGTQEGVQVVTLSYEALAQLREKFPAYLDADSFELPLSSQKNY